MKYTVTDDDYLDLWKYFEDRADNVKGAMFSSVTWALGFAGTLFGFIVLNLSAHSGHSPWLLFGASFVGLVLCGYADVLIRESREHIESNWERSRRCAASIVGLAELVEGASKLAKATDEPSGEKKSHAKRVWNWIRNWLKRVWNRIWLVVYFFATCFLVLMILALVRATGPAAQFNSGAL